MAFDFGALANSLGSAVQQIGTYSAQATARANAISAQAQSAQGAFNQNSANIANGIDAGRISSQYGFNSAMAQQANAFNTSAWERAATWNEEMWQKQADFNREEAEKQRDWATQMSNTQYQRAMADMQKAGLNPILAASGISGGVPSGATASVGGAQMSSAQANMASGGLLGASSASESNYMGIAENMGTTLALLGAIFGGLSSAYEASSTLGDAGTTIVDEITSGLEESSKEKIDPYYWGEKTREWAKDKYNDAKDFLTDLFDNGSGRRGSNKKSNYSRSDASQYQRNMSQYKSWEKYSKPKG